MSAPWEAIVAHGRALAERTILDLFAADAERATRFTFEAPHLLIDVSKEKFDARAQTLLADLA